MRLFFLFVSCALFARQLAAQERWIPLGNWQDGRQTKLDSKTIEWIDSATYRVWLRDDYDRTRVFNNGNRVKYAIQQVEFDCPGRRWRMLEATGYDAEGNVVDGQNVDPNAPWVGAAPESVAEGILETLCIVMSKTVRPTSSARPSSQ